MGLLVGKRAPSFQCNAVMADGTIEESFCFDDFSSGKYVVIFFYPLDFTFVCPSEILAFANRYEAISAMNADVLGVSIDSHHTHRAWRETSLTDGGIGAVPFPLAADLTREISRAYGVLSEAGDSYYPEGVAMRATLSWTLTGSFVIKWLMMSRLAEILMKCSEYWMHFSFLSSTGKFVLQAGRRVRKE